MADTKGISPEAMHVARLLVRGEAEAYVALALDALIAAGLQRREDAKAPGGAPWAPAHEQAKAQLEEERATHEETKTELAETRRVHGEFTGNLSAAIGSGTQHEPTLLKELREQLAAHEATRKESDKARRDAEALEHVRDVFREQIDRLLEERDKLKAELEAERTEHEATQKELDIRSESYEAAREETGKLETELADRRAYQRMYEAKQAELESLCKPLEGELGEDLATVRSLVQFFLCERTDLSVSIPEVAGAISRIEVALRAKGEPRVIERPGGRPTEVWSNFQPAAAISEDAQLRALFQPEPAAADAAGKESDK